ncbi:MAG: hypothetical protein HYY67_05890 [Thaumarchaeota archaeon]|nr:hypothetical protein [Nitrososphaerota archaeon]
MSYSSVSDIDTVWNYVREEMENLKVEVRQKLQDLERELRQDVTLEAKEVEKRYLQFESNVEERIQKMESRLFKLRIEAEASKRKMSVDEFMDKAISSFLSQDTDRE